MGQGISEFWTENTNGDKLYISCGEKSLGPPVDVIIILGDLDFPNEKSGLFVGFRVGQNEGSLTFNDNGKLNTFCTSCISNFELFWRALRSGNAIEFSTPDGMKTTFSLNGSTKAIPQQQCVT